VILSGKSSEETLVREIMSSDVKYVSPDEKVKNCLSIMTKKHFRHLPVLEQDKVIGVLSIGDVKSRL
jgi:predicted transcriptional regulator